MCVCVCCNLEAMGPGSYTISLDHGDENGDVSQWAALSSSYTDPQSISWALEEISHKHTYFKQRHSQEKLSVVLI